MLINLRLEGIYCDDSPLKIHQSHAPLSHIQEVEVGQQKWRWQQKWVTPTNQNCLQQKKLIYI